MTNQEAFEKVTIHLLTQMEKSEAVDADCDIGAECRYRGPNGLMCAIGCLITDDQYASSLEGWDATHGCIRALPCLVGINSDLLLMLQHVHDHSQPVDWEDRLRAVATRWSLTMPDLETAP
jgi:hypothetical protein